MLVELTDVKGETWWVNPAYVRIMREKKGRTEIWVTGNTSTLKIERPLVEVATEISAALQAMSSLSAVNASIDQAQQAAQAASAAGVNAAVMG